MNEKLIERCLVIACANMLQDNEGIVVIVDDIKYIVWLDANEKDRVLRIKIVEDDQTFFKEASMIGETEKEIKTGLKVWVHPNTVQ